jgi:hypothetical protein
MADTKLWLGPRIGGTVEASTKILEHLLKMVGTLR